MMDDEAIKRDVEEELRYTPHIDASDIAVAVKEGVVALLGFARSYNDKHEAEAAAKRVAGVVGVANDIEVRLPVSHERPDPEIARDAVAAIRHALPGAWHNVRVVVKQGWITLEGQVEWNFEREQAERAVRGIKGVRGVGNMIRIKPTVQPEEIKKKIEEAFRRNAELEADHIQVEANGPEVVLKGTVHSWAERQEAARAAWSAPGVMRVDNRIAIALH
jgi:osmotically-inducible protein OsmY